MQQKPSHFESSVMIWMQQHADMEAWSWKNTTTSTFYYIHCYCCKCFFRVQQWSCMREKTDHRHAGTYTHTHTHMAASKVSINALWMLMLCAETLQTNCPPPHPSLLCCFMGSQVLACLNWHYPVHECVCVCAWAVMRACCRARYTCLTKRGG